MRILHVSDIHCSYAYVRRIVEKVKEFDVDVIAITGDFECNHNLVEYFLESGVRVFAISGNMDDHYIVRLLRDLGISVESRYVEFNGYVFMGISGVEVYTSLSKVKEFLSRFGSRSIVLSHHPPRASRIDISWSGVHAGLPDFTTLIRRFKPRLWLCGHIHEGRGYEVMDDTIIVNPGPLAFGYYALIDLDENHVVLGGVEG